MNKAQIIIIILAFTFVSCTKNNKSEIVANFLNNTEKSFDKKTFELVSLDLQDTIFENDIYKYQDFKFYPAIISDDFDVLDTMAVGDEPYVQNEIYWDYEPFSLGLYNQIVALTKENQDNEISNKELENIVSNMIKANESEKKIALVIQNYYSLNGWSKFLTNVSLMKPKEFKYKLLYNNDFKNELKKEMKKYTIFKGVFSSDSLYKFIDLENVKQKNIYGFLYKAKFRTNSILDKKLLVFNKEQDKIIKFDFSN